MKKIKLSGTKKCAIVDDEDYPYVSRFRAIFTNNEVFVALLRSKMRYVQIPMWCFVIPAKLGMRVGFKNKNALDFRKENLIYMRYNLSNHRTRKRRRNNQGNPCYSKYKGVSIIIGHRTRPWNATISKDKKAYYLGYFKTEVEAAEAYNKKARELYGKFAYQNTL